jgi:hypothetical protein
MRSPKRKWGPALLPAPNAPSEGSAGIRYLVKTRRPQPALDPGSPAQASLPIEQLPLARSPTSLPNCNPEDRLSFSPSGLTEVKTVQLSAALLGPTPLASRFAFHPERLRAASRLRRSTLPAPHTNWPRFNSRRNLNIACRRRSDLWSPAATACRCRLLERPGPPSRSLGHHAHLFRVAKAKNRARGLWITGISGTTARVVISVAVERGNVRQKLDPTGAAPPPGCERRAPLLIRRAIGCRFVLPGLPRASA